MERLTKRHKYNGKDYVSVDSRKYGVSCSNFCTNCGKADCDDIRKALFKLAEYEDLEEQGKLLKLPCAVGDTVYVKMQFGGYAEAEVRDFTHFTSCGFCIVVTSKSFNKQNIPFSEFGKTVFLTRPEAERVLAEMEGKNGN